MFWAFLPPLSFLFAYFFLPQLFMFTIFSSILCFHSFSPLFTCFNTGNNIFSSNFQNIAISLNFSSPLKGMIWILSYFMNIDSFILRAFVIYVDFVKFILFKRDMFFLIRILTIKHSAQLRSRTWIHHEAESLASRSRINQIKISKFMT